MAKNIETADFTDHYADNIMVLGGSWCCRNRCGNRYGIPDLGEWRDIGSVASRLLTPARLLPIACLPPL